jgi:hypothetical protein
MASKKTKSPMDAASLNKKTVATLKTLCKKLGITCSGTKAQHIDAILMSGAEGIKEIKVPTKTTKGAKGKVKLVLEIPTASPGKCKSNEVREVTAGKCIKKTQKGEPFGSAALKKKYGDDYVFDAKLGIVGRKADVEAYRAEHGSPRSASPRSRSASPRSRSASPRSASPAKKKKAKSPAKKTKVVKKKSPAKKTKVVKKKSPAKAKTCVDEEDPLICGDQEICSAPSGRCIKNTKANRHGTKGDKAELNVDGRIIVGTVATIKKLETILGGTITLPEKKSPPKKAKSPVKKAPVKKVVKAKSPVKKAPVKKVKAKSPPKKVSPESSEESSSEEEPKEKTPVKKSPPKKKSPAKKAPVKKVVNAKSPAKKSPPKKKTPGKKSPPKKAKSPQTLAAVEKRLDELLEEGGSDTEIDALKEKLAKLKAGNKSPGTKSKAKPGKVEMKEQELYKTFMGCLSSLSAE